MSTDNLAATPEQQKPEYLGDGLYVEYDGWQVRLFASTGARTTNEVFLEPDVLRAFMRYVQTIRERS